MVEKTRDRLAEAGALNVLSVLVNAPGPNNVAGFQALFSGAKTEPTEAVSRPTKPPSTTLAAPPA